MTRGWERQIGLDGFEGEETMKLQLFFLIMDLLILMAYPVLFALGKLRKFHRKTQYGSEK